MPVTLQSRTFNVPRQIRDVANGVTAQMRRVSGDNIVPVVLEASQNIYNSIFDNNPYIGFQTNPALLNTIKLHRIGTIENKSNQATGLIKAHPDYTNKVIGVGTDFTELKLYATVLIDNQDYVIINIDTVNQVLTLNGNVPKIPEKTKLFYITYLITLQNPRNEAWNDFPTVYTNNVLLAQDNNIKFITNDVLEFFYKIQSKSSALMLIDINYTPSDAVDLKIERATYKNEISFNNIRTGDVFDDDSYINEAKDIDGEISQNIYTWKNTGAGETVSLRQELNLSLSDELIKIKVYVADIDGDGISTTDWDLSIDVKEHKLGQRFNSNFSTIS